MAWLGKFLNSSHDERQFTVYINEGEKYQIEKWVERYPNIETGGDLFGAWIDDRTAVVQFVLGPGKYCRRTSVSFFQDIDYLREAGNYLTQKHGLCNIGQWHSHHKLGLTRPSGGDENTVWGNMPNLGLDRYIVFIATITGGSYFREEKLTVNINPYLFEIKDGRKNGVLHGSFQSMERNSPFRLDKSIEKKVEFGAESMNDIKKYRKRPRENESVEETTKTPKMKTEAVQHHSAQSLPPNTGENFDNDNKGVSKEDEESRQSNFQQGDGTDRNLENVSNEDEESGQSGSQQGDGGTERNFEDVPNEKKENQTDMVGDRSLTSDEETENEQDSSQNNLAKGGNLYNPNNDKDHAITDDNKLAGDSQSKQSSASNGDGSDSYQQEGDWNKKSEPTTPTTDEDECKEKQTELMDVDNKQLLTSGIQKDDEEDSSTNNSVAQDSKNNNDNKGQVKTDNGTAFAGEGSLDGRSEQSNIPKVDGTGSNLQETSQKSTVENFDKHDSDKDQLQSDAALLGDVLRDEQPNVSQKDTASGLRGDLNENSTPATSQEDENEKQIHIMDVDSHQRSTTDTHEEHEQDPQKDAASNLTGDSNENSKHATSTLQEDENDTQEEHEQDPSQKKPAGKDVSDHDEKDQIKVDNGYQDGQRGEPDIPQKDAESDLKQSLNEDSPNNSLTNESKDFNKTTTVSEDVKGRAANDHANDKDITSEHDGELDGANNADEEMRSESEEGRNATESGNVTTENSGLEGRHDKLDEKEENQIALDDGEIGGPECCDEIVPSEGDVTERSNIIEDMEDQDPNVILHASKPADGPDETQVESMEVDNQNFSSEVATDVAVKVEKMVVDSEHLSSGNSETNVDSITLEEVLFDDGIQVKGTETEIAFLRNTEEDGCMKKDERATSKDKMGGSGAVEDFSEPLTKSEGDTVTSISVDHEDGGQERAIENLDIASEQNIIKTVKDGEHLECGIETNTSASLDDDDAGREQVTNNLAIESDQLIAKAVRDGESFEDGIDDQHNELEHNSENLLTSGKTGDHKLMNELAGDTLSDKTAFLDTANEAMDDSNTNQETEDTVKGRKKEEIADVSNNDPTHDKSLDKRNSRRSRSIFDRPPEYEKQELTSNDEESEADKKVGTEARAHAFTEKETKNEEKESQDNKQDLSEGESEKNEFDMTTAFESIDSVIGKNSKNVNENLNDGPSASEVNEDKEEAVDIQDQMGLIETVSDEVIESKSKGDKKQKKKESTEDEVGDQDNGKRKSKDTIQTDDENTEENPVDLSKNGEECVTCFGSIRKRFKHGEKSKKGKERGKEINRKGKEKGKKKGNKEGEEERNE